MKYLMCDVGMYILLRVTEKMNMNDLDNNYVIRHLSTLDALRKKCIYVISCDEHSIDLKRKLTGVSELLLCVNNTLTK